MGKFRWKSKNMAIDIMERACKLTRAHSRAVFHACARGLYGLIKHRYIDGMLQVRPGISRLISIIQ